MWDSLGRGRSSVGSLHLDCIQDDPLKKQFNIVNNVTYFMQSVQGSCCEISPL